VRVNLGAGGRIMEGWVNQDIRDLPNIELVCDALNIDNCLSPSSVSHFYSRHFFEHLTFKQGKDLLEKKLWLLKPGGKVEMVLPDLTFHCKQFVDEYYPSVEGFERVEHALGSLFGWQRESDESLWDVHKSGYSFETLSAVLKSVGYINPYRMKSVDPWHLHIVAFKGED